MLVRRIARPLLASVFIAGGIDSLKSPAQKAEVAGPWIDKSAGALPDSVTEKVPTEPETLVKINAGVQIGAGSLLALGKFPRLSALALAATLVPTTLAGHDFWNKDDPQQQALHRLQFLKNAGLLGGLLITAVDTEGKPSLGWRGRRAARAAQQRVEEILPFGSGDESPVTPALSTATEKGASLLESARDRGGDLAETVRSRAPELAGTVRSRAPELAETARTRSAAWAEAAAERGEALGDRVETAVKKAQEKAAEAR
ncbi:DoxX family protein [Rhodococcus triatomae]|uniref:Uncharacterized membrane protein YphA, DoxX/SURF4 family n=1 Tax=Rhodococcus triatomae TaxID=300028 RepID=A0A1G8CKG3_9NOCA|nr:DoxX family protein [Rhodococcus triatomae]QNG18629.1 DoxX family protein [Rhodococcus triatomae]QNG21701.1 DoxX family protein [Rhodococcus triatomae]SDH46021.1 Uncharacterized membrane protein YphA, DoxX/SURF4 family [Rhodococcus triatomae]